MPGPANQTQTHSGQSDPPFALTAPQVTLPKGGGAIRGIDETFRANPATGSAGCTVQLPVSPARSSWQPSLALTYDSGAGNGPFGLGWQLSIPSIRRKTDRGLPRYRDANDSDTFVLAGAEDLVPLRIEDGEWRDDVREDSGYLVRRYRPRVDSAFARIERWTHASNGDTFWRTVSRENVARLYGRTAGARLTDPDAPSHVFEWLLEEERDELGNVIRYEYRPEDRAGVDDSLPYERARTRPGHGCAYTYPKRIRYGNAVPSRIDRYHFELVFDYGEHDEAVPTPEPDTTWPMRPDVYSTFRAGFDVRCYRLCRRALMFHHFPELASEPTLVRSTKFTYRESPVISFLVGVTQAGHIRREAGYETQSLPPVEYAYSTATIDETVHVVEGLDDLPAGTDPRRYLWADLDAEGLAGLLAVGGSAWYYKANDGGATLAPARSVGSRPSLSAQTPGARLIDLAADGTLDLVQLSAGLAGYQQREPAAGWRPFRSFSCVPSVDWGDANLRVVDVDGDGHADLLITEDHRLRWHPSAGRGGFRAADLVPREHDEDLGPTVMFAADAETVFVADMSGDGLGDIVRIRNGSVCYWPNRGYGHFGARIVMANAPRFDAPDRFDPARLRLADIDGTGTNDLIYLGRDGVRIAFNRSGNGFEDVIELTRLPGMESVTDVDVADLLGDGTACLVWSSPLPQHANRPVRYVHLMAQGKPHLLARTINNRGRETTLRYRPSTHFYLEDKKAGKPWITRLPFPVHALERVEISDRVTGRKFVTRYEYHHGYFDGEDREFRGFGLVEEFDTESFSDFAGDGPANADIAHHQPPARTRTWWHTGAWIDGERVSRQFESEYYAGDPAAALLPDTTLPDGLSVAETREACRALKGRMLRQELYADDGISRSTHPYSVVEQSFTLRRLQPAGAHDRGAFQVVPAETLTWQYERNPDDPSVAHRLTLAHDDYGQVTQSATMAYPRRRPEHDEQRATSAVVTASGLINQDDRADAYHLGVPFETRVWELAGLVGDDTQPFTAESLRAHFDGAPESPFEIPLDGTAVRKRVISHQRHLYRSDDLTGSLPLGELGARAITFESYRLALTDGLVVTPYAGRVTGPMLEDEAGYRRWRSVQQTYATPVTADMLAAEDVPGWWAASGRMGYTDPAAAPQRFFLPVLMIDAFGSETRIGHDPHLLAATRVEDALANVTEAALDYRILRPALLTDPNGNRTAVAFDALGRVTAETVMGKDGDGEGDTLADPTVRFEYEPFRWMLEASPNRTRTYSRETHGDPATRWLSSVLYFDGSGRATMTKTTAEPGLAPVRDADGTLVRDQNGKPLLAHSAQRWVGSGRTVLDNKGNTIKQYEPYFADTDEYEDEAELVEWGVTPVFHYDPLGRNVRTDLPNGTHRLVEFDPWRHSTWDENDTVLDSSWYAERTGGALGADEQRAATLAAAHAGTPAVTHLDILGRPFLAVADNATRGRHETRTRLDVQGNTLGIIDALGRVTVEYDHDLLGRRIHSLSVDAGERWVLTDIAANPVRAWDARGHVFATAYDSLRRPVQQLVRGTDAIESDPRVLNRDALFARIEYGEGQPNDTRFNLRGRAYRSYDGAGVVTSETYDFKGNLLRGSRQLAADYTATPDWSAAVALDEEVFASSTAYDALNRPISLRSPDDSEIRPAYNDAGLLERVEARLRGSADWITFVSDIDYDAKGQRELVEYAIVDATGTPAVARTAYTYDPLTFRLSALNSNRTTDNKQLQQLTYTYDPVGNVTGIHDAANPTVFFANAEATPDAEFVYDALYQLVQATGREHVGQAGQVDHADVPDAVGIPHVNDTQAMRRYTERYVYDSVGNILAMIHRAAGGNWTRRYEYALGTNRLVGTSLPGDPPTGPYAHNPHGSMTAMPHLAAIRLDFQERMHAADLGGGGTAYYVYDASGKRVRKVHQHIGSTVEQRIYVGGWEIYRKHIAGTLRLERETLHVIDGRRRVALVETRTVDVDAPVGSPSPLIRYQLDNHLGSVSLEIDGTGRVVTHEEHHPYGSTAYRAADGGVEAAAKRYRYTGKERDEETGLYYHGARYYACLLGRWCAVDPRRGDHPYRYAANNPQRYVDPDGRASSPSQSLVSAALGALPSMDEVLEGVARTAGQITQFVSDMSVVGAAVEATVGTPLDLVPSEAFQEGREEGRDAAEVVGAVEAVVGVVAGVAGVAAVPAGATGGGGVGGALAGPPGAAVGGGAGGVVAAPAAVGLIVVGGIMTVHGGLVVLGTMMNGDIDPKSRDPEPFTDELPAIEQVQPGSGKMPSVDPVGTPWDDPLPPKYKAGDPADRVIDHRRNRARGGTDDTANLVPWTREGNARKAGFEGNHPKDVEKMMGGYPGARMSRRRAEEVLQGEDDFILNDIHPRPVGELERISPEDLEATWRNDDALDPISSFFD